MIEFVETIECQLSFVKNKQNQQLDLNWYSLANSALNYVGRMCRLVQLDRANYPINFLSSMFSISPSRNGDSAILLCFGRKLMAYCCVDTVPT